MHLYYIFVYICTVQYTDCFELINLLMQYVGFILVSRKLRRTKFQGAQWCTLVNVDQNL